MRIISFDAASYTVGFEVDRHEIAITLPHDASHYEEIMGSAD